MVARLTLLTFLSLLPLLVPVRSFAQVDATAQDAARAHFQSGTAYFERGEYDKAIAEFDEALRLSRRPRLEYNLYLAHERLGHLGDAAQHLRAYLAGESDIPNREALEVRLANLEKRAVELPTQSADASAPATSEPSAPVAVPEAVPEAAAPRARWPLYLTLATTGVGAVAFGTFAALSLKEKKHLEDSCGHACTKSEVSALRTNNLVADLGLGVAVVGATASLIVWLVGHKADTHTVGVAPSVGRRASGIATTVRF